jgi:hypothetical protein
MIYALYIVHCFTVANIILQNGLGKNSFFTPEFEQLCLRLCAQKKVDKKGHLTPINQ